MSDREHQSSPPTSSAASLPVSPPPEDAQPAPDRGGRPLLFTAEKQRILCNLVSAGWSRRRAAIYLGFSPETVRKAALRDSAFLQKLADSELTNELQPLNHVRAACASSWRAATWLLERQHPHLYGRRSAETLTRQELADSVRAAVEFAVQIFDKEPDRQRLLQGFDLFLVRLGLLPTRVPEKREDANWHEEQAEE